MIFGIFLLNILLTIDQLIKVGDSVSTKDEIPFYSCWPTNNHECSNFPMHGGESAVSIHQTAIK